MVGVYRFDDTVMVVNSEDDLMENIFRASTSLILTQNYIALTREGRGVIERFPFSEKKTTCSKYIKLGLYRVAGSTLDDLPHEVVEDIIHVVIKQHKKLIDKNNGNSVSIFSDKELFDNYFEMLRMPEIRFNKIYFLDNDEEGY